MAVTSKTMRSAQRINLRVRVGALPRWLYVPAYGVSLLFMAITIYSMVSVLVGKVHVVVDDFRYGRPRIMQIDAFVGHEETTRMPTHLLAMNLSRQVVVFELPGGDPTKVRTLRGPYLFGAEEDLTPVFLSVQDMDSDGQLDLVLDVRHEQIVYLNKAGVFRPPTPDEQAILVQGS